MTKFSKIFEPGKIGAMQLRNRIVMGAMGNNLATEDGYITQKLIDYYVERARGGVALIVTQAFNVSPESHLARRVSLYNDQFIDKLRALPDAVHQHGAKIYAQLIRRTGTAFRTPRAGHSHPILVPSNLPFQGHTDEFKEASIEDLERIEDEFAEATRRAREAGFDGVEFHGCHGAVSLASSLMSSFTNRRNDRYGGTPENRARFACEIVTRARKKVGPGFSLLFRINATDALEGGKTREEAAQHAALIEKAGADAIDVSCGMEPWTAWISFPSYLLPKGAELPYSGTIKKALGIPLICAGKIDLPLAEELLEQGKADFITMARPLLSDPELPNKLKAGRVDEIVKCIYCNNCLITLRHCTVNPSAYREKDFELNRTTKPKKVIVAGGGIAGIQAAKILAERGHQVSLYERSDKLGGQWNIAAKQADKQHFAEFAAGIERGMRKAGATILLNHALTPHIVKEQRPDAIIIATGATPKTLPVPGAAGKNVVQANDVIVRKVQTGKEVVVIGGRIVGMEVALLLAGEGKKVSLITRRNLGRDVLHSLYTILRNRLIDNGIPVYQNAPISEIKPTGVYFFYDEEIAFVKADTVVLAVGAESENRLFKELKQTFPDLPVFEVGDCVEPRNAMYATSEAADAALKVEKL